MHDNISADKKIITSLISNLNLAWLEGRIHEVGYSLNKKIIFFTTRNDVRITGREQFIHYFNNIREELKILHFNEEDFSVHLDGKRAIAHYRFIMEYNSDSGAGSEIGRDIYFFKKESGSWKLQARFLYYFDE